MADKVISYKGFKIRISAIRLSISPDDKINHNTKYEAYIMKGYDVLGSLQGNDMRIIIKKAKESIDNYF